jgi:hypothetical protein
MMSLVNDQLLAVFLVNDVSVTKILECIVVM